MSWIHAGVTPDLEHFAGPDSMVDLFGDFLICPTESYRKGAVQKALIKTVTNRRYVLVHY